jgi:hypothetical protein
VLSKNEKRLQRLSSTNKFSAKFMSQSSVATKNTSISAIKGDFYRCKTPTTARKSEIIDSLPYRSATTRDFSSSRSQLEQLRR